jgi:hypothetical protein
MGQTACCLPLNFPEVNCFAMLSFKTWEDIFVSFGVIANFFLVIPIIVALIKRKDWNLPLKLIFYYCLTGFLLNLFEHFLIWVSIHHYSWIKPFLELINTNNTHFLNILHYVKDFILLGWFFSLIFPLKTLGRKIWQSGIILTLAATLNHIFIEGYKDFGTFNPIADALFILTLPVLYLWFSQRQSVRIPLRRNPYLWISLGLIIPNVLALFLYLTGDYIYESEIVLYFKLFSLKNAFEMIGQLLITTGFLYARYARFIGGHEIAKPPKIGS